MRIRVLLADDHAIVLEGLRTLLEKQQDVEIIGEAKTGRQALQLVNELLPDVVIMDIGMPDLNGIEATRQIHERLPSTKVIALSMHSDKQFVTGMLRAGAAGYLLKDCAFEELTDAIYSVAKNHSYLSSHIADTVAQDYVNYLNTKDCSVYSILTAREREVLQLIAEGCTTKQIASNLYVSLKTVETHRQHVMEKLGMSSIAELTKYAIREGLTTLNG